MRRQFIKDLYHNHPHDHDLQIDYENVSAILNNPNQHPPEINALLDAIDYLYARYFYKGDTFFTVETPTNENTYVTQVVGHRLEFAFNRNPSAEVAHIPQLSSDPQPSHSAAGTETTAPNNAIEQNISIDQVTNFVDYQKIQHLLALYILKCLFDTKMNKEIKAIIPLIANGFGRSPRARKTFLRLEEILDRFEQHELVETNRAVFREIARIYGAQVNPEKFFTHFSLTTPIDIGNFLFLAFTTYLLSNPNFDWVLGLALIGIFLFSLNNLKSFMDKNAIKYGDVWDYLKNNTTSSLNPYFFVYLPAVSFLATFILGMLRKSYVDTESSLDNLCSDFKNKTKTIEEFNLKSFRDACDEADEEKINGWDHAFNISIIAGALVFTGAKLILNRGMPIDHFRKVNKAAIKLAEEMLEKNRRFDQAFFDETPLLDDAYSAQPLVTRNANFQQNLEQHYTHVLLDRSTELLLQNPENHTPEWELYRTKNSVSTLLDIEKINQLSKFLEKETINEQGEFSGSTQTLGEILTTHEKTISQTYFSKKKEYICQCSKLLKSITEKENNFIFELENTIHKIEKKLEDTIGEMIDQMPYSSLQTQQNSIQRKSVFVSTILNEIEEGELNVQPENFNLIEILQEWRENYQNFCKLSQELNEVYSGSSILEKASPIQAQQEENGNNLNYLKKTMHGDEANWLALMKFIYTDKERSREENKLTLKKCEQLHQDVKERGKVIQNIENTLQALLNTNPEEIVHTLRQRAAEEETRENNEQNRYTP